MLCRSVHIVISIWIQIASKSQKVAMVATKHNKTRFDAFLSLDLWGIVLEINELR